MARYRVLAINELPEPFRGGWEGCATDCDVLVELDAEGQVVREVSSDHGEPEDNSFHRDWSWVPVELNRLAEEGDQLKACIVEMRAWERRRREACHREVRVVLDEAWAERDRLIAVQADRARLRAALEQMRTARGSAIAASLRDVAIRALAGGE